MILSPFFFLFLPLINFKFHPSYKFNGCMRSRTGIHTLIPSSSAIPSDPPSSCTTSTNFVNQSQHHPAVGPVAEPPSPPTTPQLAGYLRTLHPRLRQLGGVYVQLRRNVSHAEQHQYSCLVSAVRKTVRLAVLAHQQEENPSLHNAFLHPPQTIYPCHRP